MKSSNFSPCHWCPDRKAPSEHCCRTLRGLGSCEANSAIITYCLESMLSDDPRAGGAGLMWLIHSWRPESHGRLPFRWLRLSRRDQEYIGHIWSLLRTISTLFWSSGKNLWDESSRHTDAYRAWYEEKDGVVELYPSKLESDPVLSLWFGKPFSGRWRWGSRLLVLVLAWSSLTSATRQWAWIAVVAAVIINIIECRISFFFVLHKASCLSEYYTFI